MFNAFEEENICGILVGKTEGKRPLVRPRRRWEGNIQTDRKSVGLEKVNWIHLVEWRTLANTVVNFRVT
jgi:hypothetical protein